LLEAGKQLGGAAANFIHFADAMGASATLISRVGEDSLGDEAIDRLKQLRLDIHGVSRDPNWETGKATIQLDEWRSARFMIHEPAAWDFIPADPAIVREVSTADAICFGTLAQRNEFSRESIRQLIRATPNHAIRILDLNLRKPFYNSATICQSLEMANMFKINQEELEILSTQFNRSGDELDRLRWLRDQFQLRLIALTKGAEGSILLSGETVSNCPANQIEKVIDTIGAGDSFTAAIVMGILRQDDLEKLHSRAARVAAYVCTQAGATPTLPAWL